MMLMRTRTLVHLLPWLLILGLGSCDEQRTVLRVEQEGQPSRSGAGVEAERGGPGFMGAAG